MPTCRDGHASADPRHCDQCGQPIGAGHTVTRPVPVPTTEWQCPRCGRAQTRRFCETDGYDSQGIAAPPPDAVPAPPGPAVPEAVAPPDTAGPPAVVAVAPPVSAAPGAWHVVVTADREYFDFVMADGGAEAAGLAFPRYYPTRRFELRGPAMLIGRHSTSRGIDPEIDLSGWPEDLVVSHAHAQLIARPDGRWALVDLKSLNRTYLNDYRAALVRPETEVPLGDGDRVYLGAWTVLTLHPPRPDPAAG